HALHGDDSDRHQPGGAAPARPHHQSAPGRSGASPTRHPGRFRAPDPGDAAMSEPADDIFFVVEILIGLALVMTLAHLLHVRTLIGRLVALEVIAAITVSAAALISLVNAETAAIDVALAVALVSFTGTVAFAAFFEGWHVDD